MPSVCVFAASSRDLEPHLYELTRQLGRDLAAEGWDLVFGGANIGLMNAVARGFKDGGARVVSVIPRIFAGALTFEDSDEVVVTEDLRQRKDEMDRRSRAFVTIPGGLGTLDETCEILVLKQIGLSDKPLVIWDQGRHFGRFFDLISDLEEGGFCPRGAHELYLRAGTPEEVVAGLRGAADEAEAS